MVRGLKYKIISESFHLYKKREALLSRFVTHFSFCEKTPLLLITCRGLHQLLLQTLTKQI